MARSKRTAYSVSADILQSLRWSTMANHLGFRSVAAWLTSLAENGVHDFDDAIYTMSRRRKELYAISEEEEREKPLKVNVRRAYRVELDRLFQLALSVPELQASNQRVFMDKGEFNRWLFEVMNTVTLVAERRGRILGFLYATLEETSARIVFLAVLPEYRRRGIGTALHHELKVHIPREVAFVGIYALLDSPVIPFLEKIGYLPGKQYLWMDRYA
ncbi:MAG TPA: GNAT family N-acetyltransferase [Thermoanaerobaculia bacterium]|jgi:ribosomal protein S18 acetylase RimI-like enzyme|nr:GNAT family N-acetyltransferase [Thermoanaerobaculia bacterium]